jgi:hypothetical protein
VYTHDPPLTAPPPTDPDQEGEIDSLDHIRDPLESFCSKRADQDFPSTNWKLILDATKDSLRLLDVLKRKSFCKFLLSAFAKKPKQDAVSFINTLATMIALVRGSHVESTEDTSQARFRIAREDLYVDVNTNDTVETSLRIVILYFQPQVRWLNVLELKEGGTAKGWLYNIDNKLAGNSKANVISKDKGSAEMFAVTFRLHNGYEHLCMGIISRRPNDIDAKSKLCEEFNTPSPIDATIVLDVTLARSTGGNVESKTFSIIVSPQQAYLYLYMSDNVYVVPAISAGNAQIVGILDLVHSVMMSEEDLQEQVEKKREDNPDITEELLLLTKVDDIIGGFSSLGVSIGNKAAFAKGANIKKVQLERALIYLSSLQTTQVGIFSLISPNLKATQVIEVVSQRFVGEIKSYISNRYDLAKLLIKSCYSSDSSNALLNPIRKEGKRKNILYMDTNDVFLVVETDGGVRQDVQLSCSSIKTDLSVFSRTKSNGTVYLDIKAVKLITYLSQK